MACVFKKFAFGSRNCVRIILEMYTLSTYDDVVSYVIREPSEQKDFRKSNILHEFERSSRKMMF